MRTAEPRLIGVNEIHGGKYPAHRGGLLPISPFCDLLRLSLKTQLRQILYIAIGAGDGGGGVV